ncbi:MAG: hypothetical protein LBG44_03825 [Gemmatimonadota bacterium]|jgi:tetratricopeptide (TPR) repeat protein|nr:hypothetical protein [Gemmatimonadota bacterium]
MKRQRGDIQNRRPTRRWHTPPPLIHGSETLDGGAILNEWSDGSGVILWQTSRDVALWATTPPEDRRDIFAGIHSEELYSSATATPDGSGKQDAGTALIWLRQVVKNPSEAQEDEVAAACRIISEWAAEKGRLHTALAFAQNSALTDWRNPAAAHWVATIAGRLNDHARAEGWFRRAVALARQRQDWRMYSLAFGGLGNLYIRRGNLPAARRLHTRALRGAQRGGMRHERALALHDLFVVAIDTGNSLEAERFARQALEAFGTRNPRAHILAHDVAYFWLEKGHYHRALSVFQAALPLTTEGVEQVYMLSNIARAAGGIGDRHMLDAAVARIDQAIIEPRFRNAAGRALLEVARGYFSLGSFDRAEVAALGSLASATEFRETKVQFAAEGLLSAIRERASAPGRYTPEPATRHGDVLAADIIRVLETQRT